MILGQPLAKVKFAVDGDSDDVSAMSYLQDPHKYVQFEGRGDDGASYILKYNGSQQEVIVRSPYEHFLSHHMRAPEKKGALTHTHTYIHTHTPTHIYIYIYIYVYTY